MSRKDKIENVKRKISKKYEKNKSMEIRSTCFCPICGNKFKKKTRAQVFCGSRTDTTCKDTYWNFMRYGTLPLTLTGDFKEFEITKKDIEAMVGDDSDVSEEEKKIVEALVPDEMLVESKELENEEKEESKMDDFNDVIPVEGEVPFAEYSLPEDDYLI